MTLISPSEAKILDSVFAEAAFDGIDIAKMDIRHNDDDFAYVFNRLCEKHKILVGSLFPREDVEALALREGPPRMPCMMYMLVDDGEEDEKIRFVRFYSPEIAPGVAKDTLAAISRLLRNGYAIEVDGKIQPTPGIKEPVELPLEAQGMLHITHIPSKQPYFHLELSGKNTALLRKRLQEHLDDTIKEIKAKSATPLPKNRTSIIRQHGTQPFSLNISHNEAGDVVIIQPAGKTNEHMEARFWEIAPDIIEEARNGIPPHFAPERIISDGKQLIITGKDALPTALLAVNQVDKRVKGASSLSWVSKTTSTAPAQTNFEDPFEKFIAEAALVAIKIENSELMANESSLNEKGLPLQKNIVRVTKDYLATQGVHNTTELAAVLGTLATKHYNGIGWYYEDMKDPPSPLSGAVLQATIIKMFRTLRSAEIDKDAGHGGAGHAGVS